MLVVIVACWARGAFLGGLVFGVGFPEVCTDDGWCMYCVGVQSTLDDDDDDGGGNDARDCCSSSELWYGELSMLIHATENQTTHVECSRAKRQNGSHTTPAAAAAQLRLCTQAACPAPSHSPWRPTRFPSPPAGGLTRRSLRRQGLSVGHFVRAPDRAVPRLLPATGCRQAS